MTNQKKRGLLRAFSMLLVIIMVLSMCPFSAFAAETTTVGAWTITNDEVSGTGEAEFGGIGFKYHSPKPDITSGSSGGKDYVKSNAQNGSANGGIVVTNGKSYCDYTPSADGTLTVFVGNANTKTGYVSKTDKNGTSTAIGEFIPGKAGEYNKTGFEVVQGTSWATLNIEVTGGDTYYIGLAGSKMLCYGAEFVPYTNVNGKISDSFSLGSYNIKFTNKTTGESKNATVTNGNYEILLKPNYTYSAALTGKKGYAFSSDTRLIDVTVQDSQKADLTVVESTSYTVSGAISGIADGYNANDMKVVFVPADTASNEAVSATLDLTAKSYLAELVADESYTVQLVGAYDYQLTDKVVVTNSNDQPVRKDLTFKAVPTYNVSGRLIGLTQVRGEYESLNITPTSLTFTNVDDKYTYTAKAENGVYSAALRNGAYLAEMTSAEGYTTSTHVVVKDGAVTRDLLLKSPAKTVEFRDTLYVGSDKEYKSVQSAVDAAESMIRPNNERVTIKIDSGIYREQVVVNAPKITFEGASKDNTKITWYYGIGYKYYSCVNSYYDPYADYDKFEKGDVVSYWGSAVITNKNATGFNAKNITFENSFNKYLTDEEMADGVEVNGRESIKVVRQESTNVDDRTSTERAAAYVNYADKTEFDSCAFIGSQDTLYTCNVAYDAYYKNCYIEGQTDFIYGNGDVIFDGCEINFCGYDGTEAAGYITANSCSEKYMADNGYIFRGCFISFNKDRDTTAGYYGRMWGDHAKVAFINTQVQSADAIIKEGWSDMSGVSAKSPNVTLVEYNTTYNGQKINTTGRVNGVIDTIDNSKYSVENVFGTWKPNYYTGDATTAPQFTTAPAITSNGDINAPNPGETLTITYALGADWANEDVSRIELYGVNADFVDGSINNKPLDEVLKNATFLAATSASATNKIQIPMEAAGKYVMAVVTPITISGMTGTAKFVVNISERPVSNEWSDPSNPGSIAPGSGINIYLAGDSTVKDYSAQGMYNSETLSAGSWGEFLQCFFNEDYVKVNDYAQGGRAVRSFLNEGKLDSIMQNIKAGDYLFIQFGHNDCSNGAAYYDDRFVPLYTKDTKAGTIIGSKYPTSNFPTIKPVESMKVDGRYTWDCGATYKGFMQEYIDRALAVGAIPVIVTPVARKYYNSDGKIRTHHDATMTDYEPTMDYMTEGNAYVTACKELYDENIKAGNNVLFLDAYKITEDMFNTAYTESGSTSADAIMDTGDATHSNKTGGIIQAGYIAKWIQDSNISISQYVAQPTTAYGVEPSGEYIFTIKDTKFIAKDKNLIEQPYWSQLGQALFDSIGGKIAEPEKEVSLNFATDEAMALYFDNKDTTYTDGEYSGIYTNADGVKFKTTIYQNGIAYISGTSRYGTKASNGKPVFSFVADKAANYTVKTKSGANTGEVHLYTDAACTNAVATAECGSDLVYKKTTDTAQTLYFASTAGNLYVANAEISYVVPKKLTLNFGTAETMKLYETDSESTYVDGVFAGEYTNEDGQSFDCEIYKSGIQYYQAMPQCGTKAVAKKPIFSFAADEKAMYSISVKVGTGSGTVDLYTDAQCSESVASASTPDTIVYKKKTDTAERLYFAASVSNNLYVADVTIVKSELPQEEKMTFTGNLAGVEKDDTNITLTLRSATETAVVTAEDYAEKGVGLIQNEEYKITAKGDKGVYTGSIITDDSGKADIALSRLMFDFPLDFVENYDDYKLYLDLMGYGNSGVTDAYSNITIHPAGVVLTDDYKQYGGKTNANRIMSFVAEQTGVATVSFESSVSNSDALILKVNDATAPVLKSVPSNAVTELSVIVKEGDVVTICTTTRSNLWYKTINVSYSDVAFVDIKSVADDNEALVYASVPKTMADSIDVVGFVYTTATVASVDDETSVESSTVYDKVVYKGNMYSAEDGYVFAAVINELADAESVYVYALCKSADGVFYSAPVKIK